MSKYKHPITGEPIGFGEHASWAIQNLIRKWPFIITMNVLSFIVWAIGGTTVLLWWNLAASLMAINIESVVGIGMYQLQRGDSKRIHEIHSTGKEDATHSEKDYVVDLETNQIVHEILDLLKEKK